MFIAYSIIWIATAFAVSVTVYFTGNPNALWAMLIPACIRFKTGSKSDEE